MQTALIVAALACPLATIHLTIAWRDWPPDGVGFDSPVLRAIYNVLGWLIFITALIYAVTLRGVLVPAAFALILWAAMTFVRRSVSLRKAYWLALPFALIGLVCAMLLFQDVFRDQNFGLFNLFPDR